MGNVAVAAAAAAKFERNSIEWVSECQTDGEWLVFSTTSAIIAAKNTTWEQNK